MVYDVIIVGSGPAGTHAALPLVEAGKSVLMIDGGMTGPPILQEMPAMPYDQIRRTRENQWRWFLGEDLSSIPLAGLEGGLGGGMTSGNRKYVLEDADRLLPIERKNAQVIQSLALGGLGAVWGAASAFFTRQQLDYIGLQTIDLDPLYTQVASTIGVSGPSGRDGVQSALPADHHVRAMQEKYDKHAAWFTEKNLTLTLPHSAVLTEDKSQRKANPLRDMDYFSDPEQSVYRPEYTVRDMMRQPNFTLLGNRIVQSVREGGSSVTVACVSLDGATQESHTASRVILAAGAVNTARILLASKGMQGVDIPFVGKPHVFSAVFHPALLGKKGDDARFSLCQALLIDEQGEEGIEAGSAQLYSYRSMGLFRLVRSIPLPMPLALRAAALLSPALIVADIRFPALPGTNALRLDGETVKIRMSVSEEEKRRRKQTLARIHQGLRKLGTIPARTLTLPEGSSSHYAGTVPIDPTGNTPLSCSVDGHVHGMERVLVADASMFPRLPSLPHTLTIMANARRVASGVI